MDKKTLRQWVRSQKASLNPSTHHSLSDSLCRQITATPQWQNAHTVLLYHALPDEVDTAFLLAEAQRNGKTVLLPVVVGNDTELRIFTGSTSTGAFGIEEPVGPLFEDYGKIGLAVVPGMAFDKTGNRLGRGKGYYDKLLARIPSVYRMGLCFPFQYVESVPSEPHDIKMDVVVG